MSGVASSQTWTRVKQAPTCPRARQAGNATREIPSQAERSSTCAQATARNPIDKPPEQRAGTHASSHGGDLAPDRRVGPARRRRGASSPAGGRRRARGSCGEGRTSGAGAGGRERRPEGRRGAVSGLGSRAASGAGRLRARASHPRPLPLQGSMCRSLLAWFGLVRCSGGSAVKITY